MNKEKLLKVWQSFTEKNGFILNPENKFVDSVADGVLENEKKHRLKLCPCRLRDGTFERDIELLCPCNFEIQETWKKEDRCWCGLFIKK